MEGQSRAESKREELVVDNWKQRESRGRWARAQKRELVHLQSPYAAL